MEARQRRSPDGTREVLRYERPFLVPVRTAAGDWRRRRGWLLREWRDGTWFHAEVAPVPEFPGPSDESIDAALARWLRSGQRADWEADGPLGFAAWQLDGVLPDEVNIPSAGLVPGDSGPVEWSRYPVWKAKIGLGPGPEEREDWDRRLAGAPESTRFRLDANQGLDREETARWLAWIEGHAGIEFLEQPMRIGAESDIVRLFGDRAARIALDESVVGPGDLRRFVAEGWPGIFVLKPSMLGDPRGLRDWLGPVRSRVVVSSGFETGIGFAAVLGFAASLGRRNFVDGLGTRGFFGDDGLDGWEPSSVYKGRLTGSFFAGIWDRASAGATG
jgi:O-succinylbenzoate synthase